jgi:hypothetical protein
MILSDLHDDDMHLYKIYTREVLGEGNSNVLPCAGTMMILLL